MMAARTADQSAALMAEWLVARMVVRKAAHSVAATAALMVERSAVWRAGMKAA